MGGVSTLRTPRPSLLFLCLGKGETDPLTGAGKKGPGGRLRGDVYKKSHACCPLRPQRKKRGRGAAKKKAEKPLQTNIGIARLLPEVPRSQEVPGAAQRTGQDRCESLPIPASLLPPPRRSCPPTPGGRPGPPGPPGPLGPAAERSAAAARLLQLVKMPACLSCGKGSLSAPADRDLNPGTLKLTVGGKSSRA